MWQQCLPFGNVNLSLHWNIMILYNKYCELLTINTAVHFALNFPLNLLTSLLLLNSVEKELSPQGQIFTFSMQIYYLKKHSGRLGKIYLFLYYSHIVAGIVVWTFFILSVVRKLEEFCNNKSVSFTPTEPVRILPFHHHPIILLIGVSTKKCQLLSACLPNYNKEITQFIEK